MSINCMLTEITNQILSLESDMDYKIDNQQDILDAHAKDIKTLQEQMKTIKTLLSKNEEESIALPQLRKNARMRQKEKLTTVFHYYLQHVLLPKVNEISGQTFKWEVFSTNYTTNKFAFFILSPQSLKDIQFWCDIRNDRVHTSKLEDIISLIRDIKNTYDQNQDVQKDCQQIKSTILRVCRNLTGDENFLL
ncbi:hypothetical protein DLAC_03789 [Tieghemostelium lacteum]|uniref:Uncharacterized protein n=1 Tax=Tieghemostelium lacteum TaxID=361077 RepID=A0A152A0W1_TIELA|nr:hypothetical protein DLAC_03789 [Tieghemostelium lacteum]|eukprot:KYQ99838.1 hypothetical protein DLAC_03789 [Tieghemostelium lacteum]